MFDWVLNTLLILTKHDKSPTKILKNFPEMLCMIDRWIRQIT